MAFRYNGKKEWRPKASFTELFDEVQTRESIGPGGEIYDLREKAKVSPPCEAVKNDHFTHLRQEEIQSERVTMRRILAGRDKFVDAVAKSGNDPERIKHAIVNPAWGGTGALPAVQPNLILGLPQTGWVGEAISPGMQCERSTGLYYEWTPATTHRLYENEIVKGEEPKEIEIEAIPHTFALREYALANRVYKRDLQNAYTALRVQTKAADALNLAMQLAREARVLNLALSPAVPFVAAAGAWTAAGGGLVIDEIVAAMVTIYGSTQSFPTDIMIPRQVAMQMIRTANWLATFNAGSDAGWSGVWKLQTGLENLGLRVHISDVCVLTTEQGTASDPNQFANIVGRQVLVWHRDDLPVESSRTFMLSPYTVMNEVRSGEWDREVKTRSIYWQQYEETTELLIDAGCGCRITGV